MRAVREKLLIRMINPARLARINITAWLDRRPLILLAALNITIFAAVTALRFLTPAEIYVAVVFLVPVSFGAWFISSAAGWLFAFASTAVLMIFDWNHHNGYQPAELYLNTLLHLGMFSFFVFIFTEVRILYRREQALSLRDSLTGLLNRRALVSTVAMESRRIQRHNKPLTLAYVDLDDFKQVNDNFGHDVGDVLLRELAQAMKKNVRSTDYVARLGGDEFVIVLPETDAAAARSVMIKLNEKLLQEARTAKHPVTFSIGAVTFEVSLATASDMIRACDETMYVAKQQGKNKIEYRTIGAE